jgi:predicted dehydrogenase
VIVEKPFAGDEAAARDLLHRCSVSGKRVLVNHQRAYDPCYRAIERRVQGGLLGRIQWLVGHAYGGALNGMSHVLERAIAMLGPVQMAEAVGAPIMVETGDPAVALAAMFEDGSHGVLLPLSAEGFAGVEIDLIGTEGRLRIVDSEQRVEYFRAAPSTEPGCEGLDMLAPAATDLPPPDWQALKHVMATAADDTIAPACPAARAAEVVCVIDQVRRTGTYRANIDERQSGARR